VRIDVGLRELLRPIPIINCVYLLIIIYFIYNIFPLLSLQAKYLSVCI
jgi:hypothetical protein